MPDIPPPHPYVPASPLESQPREGGYQPAEVRRQAFAAVLDGVPLGAYDKRIIEWLVELDDTTCRTLASVMWRCRLTAQLEPGAVTEWAIAFDDGRGGQTVQPYPDEHTARGAVADLLELVPETHPKVMYHEVSLWKEAPGAV